MHFLYLHQHFVTRSGTSGGRSHEFSRILVERGHRVTLVAGAYDRSGLEPPPGKLVWRTKVDGIDVIVLRVPYGQGMSMTRRMLSFAQFMALATLVGSRVKGFDLIFATSTPLTIAVPAMLISSVRRRRFVFEVRDLWPEVPIEIGVLRNPALKWAAKTLERIVYRRAARVVALSPGMKQGVIAGGKEPDKVSVIPNSSDVELFRVDAKVGEAFRKEHPEWGEGPLVVYAGAFGRVNGLEYFLELARTLLASSPDIRFVLAGTGSERERIEQLAEDLGVLGKNLYFLDALPRSRLPALLSASTVLMSLFVPIKSMETNSANKFFDAFAAGKPVVLNYGGWQAELLEQTGAGMVLDPRDAVGAASKLAAALADRKWLDSAARASRRLGDEVFNRRKLALELEEVLTEVAREP